MDSLDGMKVDPSDTIFNGLKIIESGKEKIAFVIDVNSVLVGTLSDGDIRRALLRGVSLDQEVGEVCNKNFISSRTHKLDHQVYSRAKEMDVTLVPVIEESGKVRGCVRIDQASEVARRSETVVLMLGGLGGRLRPLTLETPKPLLPVGGVPIAEIILKQLVACGFHKFILSVNYKGDLIKAHFGDGSSRNVSISYVQEKERMGTAGSLTLLENRLDDRFIVMNGDLLTKINFVDILNFVEEMDADGAVCVRPHDYTVPYGVVRADGGKVIGVEEKPTETFFVSAGVYALSKAHIAQIPKNAFYDMPVLINKLVENGERIVSFPVHEYWLDIGEISQYEKAQRDFSIYFDEHVILDEKV